MLLPSAAAGNRHAQTFSTANTLRCLAPLFGRDELNTLLGRFMKAFRKSPCPKLAPMVLAAEQCARQSQEAATDAAALWFAIHALHYCAHAFTWLADTPAKAAEIVRTEDMARERVIRTFFGGHPEYVAYAPLHTRHV